MTIQEIKKAVESGKTVHFLNEGMTVKTDKNQNFWIEYKSDFFGELYFMPLELGQGYITWLNGKESDYFIAN